MKLIIAVMTIFSAINCGENKEAEVAEPIAVSAEAEDTEQRDILVGAIQKEDLMQAPYSSWFEPTYESYEPSQQALETIKNNIGEYDIKIFMGTWCGDSRREVPRFYKLLEESNYDMDKLEVQAVRLDKTLPDDLQKEYDIHHVPTIIFYKNGEEVDRFVEYAQDTLEEDIAKIVSGEEYQDPYEQ